MIQLENYPFIAVTPGVLKRKIQTPNGIVLCECDGTSKSVRACLATSDTPHELRKVELPTKEKNHIVRAHADYARTCALDGVAQIGQLIMDSERPSEGPKKE